MIVSRQLLLALALSVSVACSQTAGKAPAAQGRESHIMEGLTIGTFPKLRAVLPGESTLVESTLENRGTSALQIPGSAAPSPLAYELLSAKDRVVRYRISQLSRDMRRTRDIAPDRVFAPQTIEPGHSVEREEDLADLAAEDFVPGKYLIRMQYPAEGTPETVSALSPITVLAPNVESFSSSGVGVQEKLVTVYAHRRDDGGVLLLQRDALDAPNEGVAFRRIQLGAGPAVQVAVAIDAVEAGNGRWFGWLRDGTFEAANGWGNRVVARLQPSHVGPADAVLLSPGFQVDVGVALFGVITKEKGNTRLKVLHIAAQGTTTAFEMELGPQAGNIRWNYQPDEGFAVFCQDAQGRVSRRSFNREGKPTGDAVLTSSIAPMAWDVAPLGRPELVSIVRAPDDRLFFRNLGNGGREDASRMEAVIVNPPEGVPAHAVFGFCTTAAGTKVVMAGAGKVSSVSVGKGDGSAWAHVADVVNPAYLHAFAPHGRTCWAEWLETGVGIRRVALP